MAVEILAILTVSNLCKPGVFDDVHRGQSRRNNRLKFLLLHMFAPLLKICESTACFCSFVRYNYTGEEFFVKKKDRGFRHVTSTAKLIIREALPIQCVEAVFVGAYLTADMSEVNINVK